MRCNSKSVDFIFANLNPGRLEESELHEREVDGEDGGGGAERRAQATDGEEAEVVAVAGRWEGLAA